MAHRAAGSSPELHRPNMSRSSDDDRPHREMAEANISVGQDQFICSVCLDLLKDPVTIPCGHSYCMSCITDCWDQEDWKGIYSCPQCRKTFTTRPDLGRNVVIAEMVEKLKKKTRLQSAPAAPPAAPAVPHTGSGDVQCDSCTENNQKAVKSCLECRSSYCQNHLEQHENLFRGKRHNLMDATGRLQDMICPQHDKMLEIYCHTDQRCICMLCLMDEHKNHDTVLTAAARKEKQRHLDETQRNIQKIIQQREKDLQQLREAVASHKRSAQTAVEDSERIFTELIRSIERRRSEVIQLIRDQERAAAAKIQFDSHLLTLDLNSVNKWLHLSEENTVITATDTNQGYPDHPDRFDYWMQAMCRESVTGCCYWEVEWSGDGRLGVGIAVTHKSIRRKGREPEALAGCNDQSWKMLCSPSSCSFFHNNIETVLPVVSSHRIGVYVDHSTGILSFYSVSDTMSLIHRVQTTFTQPLYAMFGFDRNSTVKLCRLTS